MLGNGYITLAAWEVSNASHRGTKLGWPTSRPGGNITLAPGGVPNPYDRGTNQSWPTSQLGGYTALTTSDFRSAEERWTRSEEARKSAGWLQKPCCLEVRQCRRTGDTVRSGSQRGRVPT